MQYELARLQMRDFEAAAARARMRRELRVRPARPPLRVVVGRRLIHIGLRPAPA